MGKIQENDARLQQLVDPDAAGIAQAVVAPLHRRKERGAARHAEQDECRPPL